MGLWSRRLGQGPSADELQTPGRVLCPVCGPGHGLYVPQSSCVNQKQQSGASEVGSHSALIPTAVR